MRNRRKPIDRILAIDDNREWLFMIEHLLSDRFEVKSALSTKEGIKKLEKDEYSIVLLDLVLPGVKDFNFLKELKSKIPHIPIVLVTDDCQITTAVNAMRSGADDFVAKKDVKTSLEHVIQRNLAKKKLETKVANFENEILSQSEEVLIPNHPEYKKVFCNALQDARNGLDILIESETGTGKDVLVNFIRNHLEPKPHIISVNCGAIPQSLAESELFGYEKNAFTDAGELRKGKFELAHGGILFLDEVGTMPLDVQQKMLRVLENRTVTRIGSSKEIPLDFLLISATNENLQIAVKEKRFREDLLYRLEESKFRLPSLTKFPEVIPEFINYFVGKYNKVFSKNYFPDQDTLSILKKRHWKGNVRELKKTVKLIVSRYPNISDILYDSSSIEIHMLRDVSLSERVESFEKSEIEMSFIKNKRNVTKTAKELGFKRTTLISKMEKYGLKNA